MSSDYILSLEVEAPMHRLPPWLKNAAEVTWPVHDLPAVWKSWGLHGGGIPYVEFQHLPLFDGRRVWRFDANGLPTYEPLAQKRGEG